MSEQLKPCPFCGSSAIVKGTWVPGRSEISIGCSGDKLDNRFGCPASNSEQDEQGGFCFSCWGDGQYPELVEAWNTRPIEDKLEAKITAAGDLLEQISAWMWKNQGVPEPMWADQFTAVCKMFEPEAES